MIKVGRRSAKTRSEGRIVLGGKAVGEKAEGEELGGSRGRITTLKKAGHVNGPPVYDVIRTDCD